MKNTRCTLDRLFDIFRTHGAKTLTMDDIAREFCISKKTLYQKYKNKEELLTEATKHRSWNSNFSIARRCANLV